MDLLSHEADIRNYHLQIIALVDHFKITAFRAPLQYDLS